ncbi:MAG: acyl--CoA ligase [Bacilli bacterium]|nr:acyl--CoA ligase [Bacilli bacterium]
MGKVNDYISKMLKYIKNEIGENKEKPWIKYYTRTPESLNYYQGSMYDYVKESAIKNEKRTAYTYYGLGVSYRGFLRRVDRIAAALTQFNIVENECVTICMPNTPESIALIYAINKIGAIANIIHPLSSTKDIKRALDETNSGVLFCSDSSMQNARDIKVKHFILVPNSTSLIKFKKMIYNIKESGNLKLGKNMISWSDFISYKTLDDPYKKRKANDPAAIIYSGGTTGKPKGIILSNLNFNAMALQTMNVCDGLNPGSSVLAALPIFHVFGLALCIHTALVCGMTAILVPKINTKKINSELKKYKPNIFPAVPSLLTMSLKGADPGSSGLKDIKTVVVGGDYLSPQTKAEFEKFLKDHGSNGVVKVGYGLSEASGFCCSTAPIEEKYVQNGTLGVPNPDILVKAFEPNSDIEKSNNDIGEICVTGPTIFMGYINEDKETKNTLVKHTDGKIWLHTGDLGYIDKNGFVYYTSRLKRMIISNGYNIYPIELEEIIKKCKYVEDCTVVAVPHKIKSQTPKAVIVLKKDVEDTLAVRSEIRKYCMDNIARYAIPTEFEYRKDIPKTAIGKVAYRDLQK